MPQRTAHIRLQRDDRRRHRLRLALTALRRTAAPTTHKTAHASGKTVHVIEHAITDTEVPGSAART